MAARHHQLLFPFASAELHQQSAAACCQAQFALLLLQPHSCCLHSTVPLNCLQAVCRQQLLFVGAFPA
jgi:hypothetical protein